MTTPVHAAPSHGGRRGAPLLLALLALALVLALSAISCRADLLGGERREPIPDAIDDVRERVRHATAELAAAQAKLEGNRDSRLASLVGGLRDRVSGWVYDTHDTNAPSRASQAYESVKSTVKDAVKDVFTPEKYQAAMHRMKVLVGAENPTLYEKIRAAFGGDKYESVQDQLRHAFGAEPATETGFWTRIKTAIGGDESVLTKLKNAVGLGGTPLASDYMHRLKVAIGAEDPTTWERIREALEPDRGFVDRLLHPFAEAPSTAETLYGKVKTALHGLDPRVQETTMDRIRIALGIQDRSMWEQLKHRYGQGAHEAVESATHVTGELAGHAYEKASELLSAANIDEIAHKIKLSIGVDDPTTYEKIRAALYPEPTMTDTVRGWFIRHGLTREQLMDRASEALAGIDPARRESYLTKVKKAFGIEKPSLMDRIRSGLASSGESALETGKELLSGDAYDAAVHKIKVALGAEDPTYWESIKSALTHDSVGDRVRSVFGREKGVSAQELYDRIKARMPTTSPGSDSVLHKIGVSLGVSSPTIGDRLHGLKERVMGTATDVGQKADELLRGSTYDEAVHKIKTAIGVEDPTLWERVQSALQPHESIGDKIRHALGRDTGISREDLVERVKTGLASLDPTRRTGLVTKVKEALGMEEPRSLLERMKDRIGEVLPTMSSRGETSIDQALHAFRTSLPENRDEAYKQLQHALQTAKVNMEDKATSLFEMLGGGTAEPSTISKLKREFTDKVSHLYGSMQQGMDHLKSEVGSALKRGSRKQYLLESTREDDGVSSHYINDNGQETLDITGDKAAATDKLKVLNSFRKDFNLEAHSSIPENASVQLHSVKRPHVLIKSMKTINGDRFDYTYDDGEETLSVEWSGQLDTDKTLDADTQQRVLKEFRDCHGLSSPASTSHSVKVRGHVHHKQDL